ncbi:hypothetical protein Tco_1343894 [Tanacetum coccineum]
MDLPLSNCNKNSSVVSPCCLPLHQIGVWLGKLRLFAVDRCGSIIPWGLMVVEINVTVKTDIVKLEVEIETVGECVDEIDKLAELIGKHEAVQLVVCKSLTNLTSVTNLLHSSGRVGFSSIGGMLSPSRRSDLTARVVIVVSNRLQFVDREAQIAATTPALPFVTQPRLECLLPTPKWKSCGNYARYVNQILQNLNNMQIPLAKSDDDDAMMTSSDGTVEGDMPERAVASRKEELEWLPLFEFWDKLLYAAGTTRKYTTGAREAHGVTTDVFVTIAKGWSALTEEEIAFLADPRLPDVQNSQSVITHNAAYQADDLDASTLFYERTSIVRLNILRLTKELKDIFNNFNQYLVEELADVQKVFYQMEQAVEQHRLESRTFDFKLNHVLSENERLLAQAIDNYIVKTVVNLSVNASGKTVNECKKCLELKTELLNKKDFVDKETHDKLCKSFTTLEKHCITLEADSQLNQEIFQQENSVLKQEILSSFLISNDFSKGSVDPTLFIRREGNELLLVQIYVDDI